MKLSEFQHVHFIGIGGIGISALARLCVYEGKQVTGTNDNPSPQTLDALRDFGVDISLDTTTLPVADLYVFSEAWRNLNPALLEAAVATGKPCLNYFEALGMVANEYYLIAVAGSHGKTTTTAMLIDILEVAGLDPSAIVGSLRAKTKSNYRAGKSKYFIVEACEYRKDFLSLTPDVLVITNIEYEHVDFYPDLTSVQAAFRQFVRQVRPGGFVIANLADANVRPCFAGRSDIVYAGAPRAIHGTDEAVVTVVDYGKYFRPSRQLSVPGVHNQFNAAAAAAAAAQVGIATDVADEALAKFAGTWRRFEYKGEVNGAKVYDDYGHHPTEITATIKGARQLYPYQRLSLVFQSHTYSRTHALLNDFVTALQSADRVYVLPIYAAREENVSGITHTALAAAVGDKAVAVDDFPSAVEQIRQSVGSNDVVIVMGAGDITEVANLLTK